MSRDNKIAWLISGLFFAILACLASPRHSIAPKGTTTINLIKAKELASACILYAENHEGRFPMDLSELELGYIPPGALSGFRCFSMGNESTKFPMDWLYFGGGFDETNRPALLIASPQATRASGDQKRIAILGDTSGAAIKEEAYTLLLAKTVKQMEAMEDARRPEKTSATPADNVAH